VRKYKRFLDFDQFLDHSALDSAAKVIFDSRNGLSGHSGSGRANQNGQGSA
jgi:hypothetical protein